MKIATIYTLYGRRAGAELCFEKTVDEVYKQDNSVEWIIFCNKEAEKVIKERMTYATAVYNPYLDNQYNKAFWLEFLSQKFIKNVAPDCFWIPSGCNHFPGKWNIPVLTTFHDLGEYHIANKYSFARMFFRKHICIPRSVSRSSLYTTVSEFTKKDMLNFLDIKNPESIKVVYNGRSPYNNAVPANALEIIKKCGVEENKFFFTPGRTDYVGKGLDVLLKAFRRFAETDENTNLVLVGPQGEGHERLMDDIKSEPRFADRIKYLGRVDDDTLASLYAKCKATVISSRFEGFGFPVLEAMERGSLVISSDAGSLPEVVGDAAYIFTSGDADGLFKAMCNLSSLNEQAVNDMHNKGMQRISMFDWTECAKLMLDCFRKISLCE